MLHLNPDVCLCPQSVLLNLVLAVVLEGASDQMKEKHAAQKFRDNTLALFHRQYMRLAMQRWNVKARAEVLLEKGLSTAYSNIKYYQCDGWRRRRC